MQSLLPSSFESSGHVFLAPRWPSHLPLLISLFLSVLLKVQKVLINSPSPGNTANVCIFLTTTPSFCRTSSRSCWKFLQNLMSVSVLTAFRCLQYLPLLQRHQRDNTLVFLSGDQGLIHNLILDSRIIGQLASRVWKNKDLNSWVDLLYKTFSHHQKQESTIMMSPLNQTKWLSKNTFLKGMASWLYLRPLMEE